MNFDWYQGTFAQEVDEVLPVLQDAFGVFNSVHMVGGKNSYEHGAEIRDGSQALATAWWGGINGRGCHVKATGAHAPRAAAALRRHFPVHAVSRVDSKGDYSKPGAWDEISGIGLDVAEKFDIKVVHQGDFMRGVEGRTLYLGAKSSHTKICIYEKGKQLGADPDWVRVEVRAQPKSTHKQLYSQLSPTEVFGTTRWTCQLAERLETPAIARVKISDPWTPTDEDRALKWMLRQYGGMLTRNAGQLGGWDKLGVSLGEQIRSIAEADAAVRSIARGRG